jgi:hypothetical protein
MGGIGKTAISVKFAQQVQHVFNSIIWRSLQNAPPVNDILATLIQILSNQQETPANLPESTSIRITRLNERLLNSLRGKIHVENQLNQILTDWKTNYPQTPGYTADNVRNLLEQLNQGSRLASDSGFVATKL